MDQPASNSPASAMRKPSLPLGATTTILLMIGLCAPLCWYAGRLLDRYGPSASLSGLPVMALLPVAFLLALPFAALRLLHIDWQARP